jgi:hypothetical protein
MVLLIISARTFCLSLYTRLFDCVSDLLETHTEVKPQDSVVRAVQSRGKCGSRLLVHSVDVDQKQRNLMDDAVAPPLPEVHPPIWLKRVKSEILRSSKLTIK